MFFLFCAHPAQAAPESAARTPSSQGDGCSTRARPRRGSRGRRRARAWRSGWGLGCDNRYKGGVSCSNDLKKYIYNIMIFFSTYDMRFIARAVYCIHGPPVRIWRPRLGEGGIDSFSSSLRSALPGDPPSRLWAWCAFTHAHCRAATLRMTITYPVIPIPPPWHVRILKKTADFGNKESA